MPAKNRRAIVIVIDAWGVGAMPDATEYGDAPGANTMANIDKTVSSLSLPNLQRLGLGNLLPLSKVASVDKALGSYGKMSEFSKGKDTTTGHWEMAGIYLEQPFPTYPDGFPPDVINRFMAETGVAGILGNKPSSGTVILDELGEEHLKTGLPIVYTSADSVFQIACHIGPESKVDLDTLYRWCEIAREILRGKHEVSRVIARPFTGEKAGAFKRVSGSRRDYAVSPPERSCLERVRDAGGVVLGIGKIEDIFCFQGLTHTLHTGSNAEGQEALLNVCKNQEIPDSWSLNKQAISTFKHPEKQFIFVNLVETDSHYGHRRDVEGYARALEAFDQSLGHLIDSLTPDDILMITGDHGCDPTAPGSDHTREFVPILTYQSDLEGQSLGIRESFADIGKTVLDWLDMDDASQKGRSLLNQASLASH